MKYNRYTILLAQAARFRLVLSVLMVFCVSLIVGPSIAVAQTTLTVGVVADGPSERDASMGSVIFDEINASLQGLIDVSFPVDRLLVGDWSVESVQTHIDTLMADPSVDAVLTLGPIGSMLACHMGEPPKPVIAAFVLELGISQVPFEDGTSGVHNLNYIVFMADFKGEIDLFREVADFDNLTILATAGVEQAIPEMGEFLQAQADQAGVELTFVPVAGSAEEALAQIPEETEAVYVAPLLQLEVGGFDRIVEGLIERRLPSFSVLGRSEVDRGLLTSLYPDTDFSRIGRRIALNLERIFLDREDPGDVPVLFVRGDTLSINMETARAIGVYPNWEILTEAEILHQERDDLGREVTLVSVVEEALAVNLDLAAMSYRVDAGEENIDLARAALLPQLEIALLGRMIDGDRAEASMGMEPERLFRAGATLTQLIYDDGAWANLDIQEHLQLSLAQSERQLELDIIHAAITAYLTVLQAKTLEQIGQENLRLTRANLEIAEVRVAQGVSGLGDVYRWEAELASNRQQVIDAISLRNQAELQLNRLLNQPIEEHFLTAEVSIDNPALMTTADDLGPYVDNPWGFRVFRDFMVVEALNNSPEIAQLDEAIAAQERVISAAERSFYVPTVGLQGDVFYFTTDGAGTEGFDFPIPVAVEEPDDINWEVSLFVSLPLYTGGSRNAQLDQAELELLELSTERDRIASIIEQNVRSGLHQAGSSFASIRLAEDASEAASAALELVTEEYLQGTVSITQLLDAQNAAMLAESSAANALYVYLIDFATVQRAVGAFDITLTPDEGSAFLERLQDYFQEREVELGQ